MYIYIWSLYKWLGAGYCCCAAHKIYKNKMSYYSKILTVASRWVLKIRKHAVVSAAVIAICCLPVRLV